MIANLFKTWALRAILSLALVLPAISAEGKDAPSGNALVDSQTGVVLKGYGRIESRSDCGCNKEIDNPGIFHMALSTDLIKDAALIPNLKADFWIPGGWSAGLSWEYIWIKNHSSNRHWRFEGGELNIRKWIGRGKNSRPFSGQHIGLYAQAVTWQIAFGRRGYLSGNPHQGLNGHPNWGIGVDYGYSLPISKRLNLDFDVGVGYFGGGYQKYHNKNGVYCWEKTKHLNWWGPTKAEISLVWIL